MTTQTTQTTPPDPWQSLVKELTNYRNPCPECGCTDVIGTVCARCGVDRREVNCED